MAGDSQELMQSESSSKKRTKLRAKRTLADSVSSESEQQNPPMEPITEETEVQVTGEGTEEQREELSIVPFKAQEEIVKNAEEDQTLKALERTAGDVKKQYVRKNKKGKEKGEKADQGKSTEVQERDQTKDAEIEEGNEEVEKTSKKKRKKKTAEVVEVPEDDVEVLEVPKRKKKKVDTAAEPSEKQKTSEKRRSKATAEEKGKQKSSGKHIAIKNPFLRDQWEKGFSQRTIAYCSNIAVELLEKLDYGSLENLKQSAFRRLFNRGKIAYPKLTRLFYLNMSEEKGEDGELVLSTYVNGIHIKLTHEVVAYVLRMPRNFNLESIPDKKTCVELGKNIFCLDDDIGKQLTHAHLTCEGKILFNILIRCLIPRATSMELVTDKFIEIMYMISQGFDIDAPSIIMEHMLFCSNKNRNYSLPYGNILPLFFKHFGVPLDEEESISLGFGMVDEAALNRWGIGQNKQGTWKYISQFSEEELQEKKLLKSRSTTPRSTVETLEGKFNSRFASMENSLTVIRKEQLEMKKELGQFKSNMETQMNEALSIMRKLVYVHTGQPQSKPISEMSIDSDSSSEDSEEEDEETEAGKTVIPERVTSTELFEQPEAQGTEVNRGGEAAVNTEQDITISEEPRNVEEATRVISNVVKDIRADAEGSEADRMVDVEKEAVEDDEAIP